MERRSSRRLVDPAVWEHLLGQVSPQEALDVGLAAYTRGERHVAEAAWRQVIESGHPDWAPAATASLGNLLQEQGEVAGARAAYQQAIDSGHPDATTRAQQALRELGPRDR